MYTIFGRKQLKINNNVLIRNPTPYENIPTDIPYTEVFPFACCYWRDSDKLALNVHICMYICVWTQIFECICHSYSSVQDGSIREIKIS